MPPKHTVHTGTSSAQTTLTIDQTTHGNAEHAERSGLVTKEIWTCHSCGAKIETGVALSQPPTHSCPKKAGSTKQLEKVGDSNE